MVMKHLFYCLLVGLSFTSLKGQQAGSGKYDWTSQLAALGNTGLIHTPSAYLSKDRTLSLGTSYTPADYALVDWRDRGDKVFFANIAFLPFLETTVRVTKPVGSKNEFGIGDRSIYLRLRLLKERKYLPSLVVGAHDAFGIAQHPASYIVASKSISINTDWSLQTNLGYGRNFTDNRRSYLNGPFGGITASWRFLAAVIEYDSERLNAGLKTMLLDERLCLNLSFMGMDALGGGMSYQFRFR